MITNDKLYNQLKFLALVGLPVVATFIFALGTIWGWGDTATKISASIGALDALLGGLLQLSTAVYTRSDERFDGVVRLGEPVGEHQRNAGVKLPNVDVLEGKKEITLKVVDEAKLE